MDRARYLGTSYKASNWIHFGATQGRGRMDRNHAAHSQAIKDIYVYPLCRHAREKLRSTAPPVFINRDEDEAEISV